MEWDGVGWDGVGWGGIKRNETGAVSEYIRHTRILTFRSSFFLPYFLSIFFPSSLPFNPTSRKEKNHRIGISIINELIN